MDGQTREGEPVGKRRINGVNGMNDPPTPRYGAAGIEHVAIEGMERFGKAT